MASVRNLKKDINYVVSEIVVECFTYNFLFPEKNQESLATIISESLELRLSLMQQVNGVKVSEGNTAKKQYRAIRKNFSKQVEELVVKLEKLEKE